MSSDFIDAAQIEEQRLLLELRQVPAFQKLEAIRVALHLYGCPACASRHQPQNEERLVSQPRTGTLAAAVLDGAEAYLNLMLRRAKASEITQYLTQIDVVQSDDEVTVRTVASYLSTAKDRFNNVRGPGGGYGLRSWDGEKVLPVNEEPKGGVIVDGGVFENILNPGVPSPTEPPPFLRPRLSTITADSQEESAA